MHGILQGYISKIRVEKHLKTPNNPHISRNLSMVDGSYCVNVNTCHKATQYRWTGMCNLRENSGQLVGLPITLSL